MAKHRKQSAPKLGLHRDVALQESEAALKIRTVIFLCAAYIPLSGCGQMNQAPNAGQQSVQAQSMEHMLTDVNQIRAFVYGSGNQAETTNAAKDLVSWSNRMAELFPPGQASTDYVDMSPERVRGAPEAMKKTTNLLLAAVQTGNRTEIRDQLTRTERDGCGFCHLTPSGTALRPLP